MILIETTRSCPAGFASLVALEQIGARYTLHLVPDGHFAARGGHGPRLVDGELVFLGRDAIAHLMERALAEASPALRAAFSHLATTVVPAILRTVAAPGGTAAEALAAELGSMVPLVEAIGPAEWATGAPVAPLVTLPQLLQRRPELAGAVAPIAARLASLWASAPRLRAEARLDAASLQVGPEAVLDFWFGAPIADEGDAMARARRWFQGGAAFDAEVREHFLPTIEAALRGELDGWTTTVHGRLALVIVLDQLTRNVFRGDARTWSGDARARALCEEALAQHLDAQLSWIEAKFLTMPLLHAEDAAAQRSGCALAHAAAGSAPPQLRRIAAAAIEQAEKYGRIIERFGRFPFRNAALGRASTPEEVAFLVDFEGKQAPQARRDAR